MPSLSLQTDAARDRRMRWFREARFGMFVHWGVYSTAGGVWKGKVLPGVGEWLLHNGQIPVDEYEPLRDRFNPMKFDADRWARTAKDAGMRYLVITSKHHDGFCLWDSALTEWDVMASPFRRDILKELAQACRRHGVRLCFYHSIMDWHHPDYLPRRAWDKRPTQDADFERYVAYLKGQLKELLTRYGPIGILWFDGEWEGTWTHPRGQDLYDTVRSLQPDILVNNRVDKGRNGMQGLTTDAKFAGDYGTPEQEIPPTGLPGVDWESCMTMNDTWGFKANDQNWKSADELLRNLIDIASKGGNYLLNVGPTGEGEIPAPSVERLQAIGAWMRKHGEAIYGTQASPFPKPLPWGRVTHKTRRGRHILYLHAFDTAARELALPGLETPIRKVETVGERRPQSHARAGGGPVVVLSSGPGAGTIPVYAVELAGPPQVRA